MSFCFIYFFWRIDWPVFFYAIMSYTRLFAPSTCGRARSISYFSYMYLLLTIISISIMAVIQRRPLCVSLCQWNAIEVIDILNKEWIFLWSIPSSSLFQYFVINYIFECQWNTCHNATKKSRSKNWHNSEKNAFWIVSLDSMDCSLDSELIFQVSGKNIYSNNRDNTKCQSFCMLTTMTMPRL